MLNLYRSVQEDTLFLEGCMCTLCVPLRALLSSTMSSISSTTLTTHNTSNPLSANGYGIRNNIAPPEDEFDMDSASAKVKHSGAWGADEHEKFMIALAKHGEGNWKAIAADVGTRDSIQVCSQCWSQLHS